jgi:serine protease Do
MFVNTSALPGKWRDGNISLRLFGISGREIHKSLLEGFSGLVTPRLRLLLFSLALAFLCILLLSSRSGVPADTGELSRRSVVVQVAETSSPAVVNISSEVLRNRGSNPFYQFHGRPLFEEFFRDFFESPSRSESSLGSGVIIRPEGIVLTNEHVILRAERIKITLLDGREFEGKLIGSDPESDLAVIKIVGEDPFPTIKIGISKDLMIGETVIAIGNPFGLSHTVTAGVISSLHRSINAEGRIYRDFIQTDASINPGNSGGPLLNIEGNLIGINTAIYREAQGIGFAIPVDRVKRIVDDLIAYGEVHSAWIGIRIQEINPPLAKYFGYDGKGGVVVAQISPGSPGEKGGVEEGDIVEQVGRIDTLSLDDYYHTIRQFTVGDDIDLQVFRGGKRLHLTVLGGEFPRDLGLKLARSVLGIEVAEIDDRMIQKYNLYTRTGVVVTSVDPQKVLGRIGLQPGDVIRQIGDQTVAGLEEYRKAARVIEMRRNVLFQIQRGPWANYVTIDIWGDQG